MVTNIEKLSCKPTPTTRQAHRADCDIKHWKPKWQSNYKGEGSKKNIITEKRGIQRLKPSWMWLTILKIFKS